ncbi:1-aminocyclopropane-1-carboxylate deaminase/D-cysteine desulfhydrase [Corallincola luteus]|nr:pyridoxal-phosphate dependent enzyme [Corallincola luteus]
MAKIDDVHAKLRDLAQASPLMPVPLPLCQRHGITLYCKRDDLIHGEISGNKWRKLKYGLLYAAERELTHLLSFGGAFSNHIAALAAAGHHFGFTTTGIIRGEPDAANPTLKRAAELGMKLHFVDRQTYRRRHEPEYLEQLRRQHRNTLILPEGGSHALALPGVGEILTEIDIEYDSLITAVGSGGTLAGLIAADQGKHQLLGIPVVKDNSLAARIERLVAEQAPHYQAAPSHWQLLHGYSAGGYGKVPATLQQELIELAQHCPIPLEPVYTGKAFLALMSLIKEGYFPAGHKIIFLHTGGLQGLAGLAYRGLFQMPNTKPN